MEEENLLNVNADDAAEINRNEQKVNDNETNVSNDTVTDNAENIAVADNADPEPAKPKIKAKNQAKKTLLAKDAGADLNHVPVITFEKIDAEISDADTDEEPHEEENFDHLSREELIELLENLVKLNNINEIKTKVSNIKVSFWKISRDEKQKIFDAYIADGGKKEDFKEPEDKLEERYNVAFSIYKEKRNKYLEEQEKEKQENLQKKMQILEELKVLINSEETLKKTYDDFKALQERWSAIGQVTRTEVNTLWQNYHYLVDKFFDKVKINKELKDLDLKKNVEKQLALCEKAEELLLEPSILKSFKQLQEYHDKWKEIGPVSPEKKEDLWERFKSATDRINLRRREYYDNLHMEQEKNLIAKIALCEKIEQIYSLNIDNINDWKKYSDEISEIQKVWKTIGYTPKKNNNEIWDRFRNAVNSFHSNKNEYFNKFKEEQVNNYNLKLNLCVRAEALQDSQDWKKSTNEFINLQNEWKSIGPVSAKYSNKLWKRFRAACNIFFENKAKYFSNIEKSQEVNLNLKLELIKKVEEYQHVEDNSQNLQTLKEFQKQWMEIGHVPNEQKDKIYNDFKNAVNRHFEKMKVNPSEKIDIKYKSRFDTLQDSPNADWAISKELNFLNTKIISLKNDIKLWENNIGFLANSRNADILKEEFRKKIDSAKEQMNSFIEKQCYLNGLKKNYKKK